MAKVTRGHFQGYVTEGLAPISASRCSLLTPPFRASRKYIVIWRGPCGKKLRETSKLSPYIRDQGSQQGAQILSGQTTGTKCCQRTCELGRGPLPREPQKRPQHSPPPWLQPCERLYSRGPKPVLDSWRHKNCEIIHFFLFVCFKPLNLF